MTHRRSQRRLAVAAWSGPLTGISFVAGLGGAMARSDHPYPRPGSRRRRNAPLLRPTIRRAVDQRRRPTDLDRRVGPFQRLGRQPRRTYRPWDASLRAAPLIGGGLAVASLATSAVTSAVLTGRRGRQEKPTALARRAFIAGGPVHGVGFGLIVGAMGWRAALWRPAPAAGSRRARVGRPEPALAALPGRRASRLVDPYRSLLRLPGHGHRGSQDHMSRAEQNQIPPGAITYQPADR